MDDAPYRERRYRPHEVRRLVQRAAAIEERREGSTAGQDLTAEEIADRVAVLGISPEALKAAEEETELDPSRELRVPSRGPVVIEQALDGGATDEAIVTAIREEAREVGAIERLGGALVWRGQRSSNGRGEPTLSVSIRREGGVTRVRIEQHLWPAKVIGWVGMAMPLALAGGINGLLHPLLAGKVWLAVVLFSTALLLAALVGMVGSSALQKAAARKAKRIASRLVRDFPSLGAAEPSVRTRVEVTGTMGEPPAFEEQAAQEEQEATPAARGGGARY